MSKKKTREQKTNFVEIATSGDMEVKKLIIFIVIIVVLFGAFYIISQFVDRSEDSTTSTQDEAAVIQYDEIILGTLLEQSDGSYYVLVSDPESGQTQGVYEVYKSAYTSKEDALKVYTSDITSPFNQKYKADESNFEIDTISDLRIKGDTLIKVEDHQLTEYFEGKEEIINELKRISE